MKNYLSEAFRPITRPKTPKVGAAAPVAATVPRIVNNDGNQKSSGPKPTKALTRGGVALAGKRKGDRIF